VVIDVSFISLRLVLPAVLPLMTADAWLVALVKPQFEAGPGKVNRRGVVRDAAIHREVLHAVLTLAAGLGLPACGLARSPITGPAGNVEFLAWLQQEGPALDVAQAVNQVTG
jgi:23S rRNA (cytidine1920-2'-O)/16S rRNA (cytidine1409-2'-O)-methyltransferase